MGETSWTPAEGFTTLDGRGIYNTFNGDWTNEAGSDLTGFGGQRDIPGGQPNQLTRLIGGGLVGSGS